MNRTTPHFPEPQRVRQGQMAHGTGVFGRRLMRGAEKGSNPAHLRESHGLHRFQFTEEFPQCH